jgi:arylsulfatase A-like enzyme
MKIMLVLLVTLCLIPYSALQAVDIPAKKPNIVFIFADDHQQSAMSCMGNQHLKTPNIDRLAKEGVLFENAFVTTAICCASRASILTGQHAARHGINSFYRPLSAEHLDKTYPILLRNAGYRTAFLGKYAIGNPSSNPPQLCLPEDKFDLWYGFPQGINFDQKGRYLTTIMEEKVSNFIKEQSDDHPFLIVMALKEPHGPYNLEDPELPPNLISMPLPVPKTLTSQAFDNLPAAIRNCLNTDNSKPFYVNNEAKFQEALAIAYRYIARADIAVGRVMQMLQDKGCADNTVVIYSSDHGFLLGEHGLVGKWSMYEESVRVPYIIRDPRLAIDKRGRRSQVALNIDIAPTILSLAGVPIPQEMQGQNLMPILLDPAISGREDWYYEHDIHLLYDPGTPLPKCEGVRNERWKYIRQKDTAPLQEELFDLKHDPQEEHNLANDPAHAATLSMMSKRCDELKKIVR